MFWLAVRGPFGDRGAAFAGALLALSPWSALFGDRVWNPNTFVFVEAAAFLAAVTLRTRPESRWAALALPVACLALPQLHMSAPVVWLALLPIVARSLPRANRPALAAGVALGALLYLPLILYEARTGMSNTRALIAETVGRPPSPHGDGATRGWLWAPVYALRFLTLDVTYHELTGYWGGLDEAAAWRALWHGSAARPFHPLRLATLIASLVLFAAAAVVVVRQIARSALRRIRERAAPSPLAPFVWSAAVALAADMLLLAVSGKRVFAHYVICVLPFVFVLYAALGRAVLDGPRSPGGGRMTVAAAVLGLALLVGAGGVEATLSISRRIDGRNGLGVIRAVTGRIFSDVAPPPARGLVVADLQFGFPALSSQYTIFARYGLKRPLELRRGGDVPRYRLQKREDPAPPSATGAPPEQIGPVELYRLR